MTIAGEPLRPQGLPGVPTFPESPALSDTRGSLPSMSAFLPRVPEFWHSGKHMTLGEFCFYRSVRDRAMLGVRGSWYLMLGIQDL
jgi:hypothetical protein